MHRTLKEDTAKPPARTITAQQKKFDRFRLVFNHERPHEALANETPELSTCPARDCFPSSVACFKYPRSFETLRVNNSGDISWHKGRVFVSEVFRNEEIGLEQMDDDVHRVFFCNTELGEFNSSVRRFEHKRIVVGDIVATMGEKVMLVGKRRTTAPFPDLGKRGFGWNRDLTW